MPLSKKNKTQEYLQYQYILELRKEVNSEPTEVIHRVLTPKYIRIPLTFKVPKTIKLEKEILASFTKMCLDTFSKEIKRG